MLLELKITDFILIEKLHLKFSDGFCVLTGETGAGKSMILGALSSLLGSNINKDMIKLGCDKSSISAVFTTSSAIDGILEQMGIEADEIITISREINQKGKSLCRLNGEIVTLSQVKKIAPYLLNIHGQLDNQQLFDQDYQLSVVDNFSAKEILPILDSYQKKYTEYKAKQRELKKLEELGQDREKKLNFLLFQDKELSNANLLLGEDEKIESELEMLSRSEEIIEILSGVVEFLSDSYDEYNVISKISSISQKLSKIGDVSEKLSEISERFENIKYELSDVARDLSKTLNNFDVDPERIGYLENRVDELNEIKFKYGGSIENALKLHEQIGKDIFELQNLEEQINNTNQSLKKLEEEVLKLATKLTASREKSAKNLANRIQDEIRQLNMKDSIFKIEFSKSSFFQENGVDNVEFVISTNKGQPLKPLKKTLSGGELSRVMLGLKLSLNEADDIAMVFDEIDSGISGITADVVGEKIKKLSKDSQILCITHLAQIARFANQHFLIEKTTTKNETITKIKELDLECRILEIARLVGGQTITNETINHAKAMLEGVCS